MIKLEETNETQAQTPSSSPKNSIINTRRQFSQQSLIHSSLSKQWSCCCRSNVCAPFLQHQHYIGYKENPFRETSLVFNDSRASSLPSSVSHRMLNKQTISEYNFFRNRNHRLRGVFFGNKT